MSSSAGPQLDYESLSRRDGNADSDDEGHSWTTTRQRYPERSQNKRAVIAIITLSCVLFVLGYTFSSENKTNSLATTTLKSSKVKSKGQGKGPTSYFSIRRQGYEALQYFGDEKSEIVNYGVLGDYDGLIEPHVRNEIVFSGPTDDVDSCEYGIANSAGVNVVGGMLYSSGEGGTNFTLPCNPYEKFDITISCTKDGEHKGDAYLSATCLYVRREIRQLSDADLDAAINAMYAIWSHSESEGQEKYGEDFHAIDWFAGMHLFNSAWKDGDHFHEGLGFLPQHIKSTNLFEKAMQAVDRSVTLFYWDFTMDNQEGLNLRDSPMFTEKTFGEIREPADSYWGWTYRNDSIYSASIKNGLWEKLRSIENPYNDIPNGFGYMRAPWNMNPSPYVSRFTPTDTEVPGCSSYYSWLGNDDFSTFMKDAGYGPHGSTHGSIGSLYGCDAMDELREAGVIESEDKQLTICSKWGFYIKELYRGNYIKPDKDCTADSSLSFDGVECGFQCVSSMSDSLLSFLKEEISLKNYVPSDIGLEGWTKFADFICTGNGYKLFVGDHLESASPHDPSFWPIHPTQDRLLQLKYMTGGFAAFTWPTDVSFGGDYVCNHANCYDYNNWDSNTKGFKNECCYGHFEDDQMLDFISGNRSKYYGQTNKEILDSIDPVTSYSQTYVYADFSFDHCTGQDFDSLISTLYTEHKR